MLFKFDKLIISVLSQSMKLFVYIHVHLREIKCSNRLFLFISIFLTILHFSVNMYFGMFQMAQLYTLAKGASISPKKGGGELCFLASLT